MSTHRPILLLTLVCLSVATVFAQPKMRKLGPVINHPGFNNYAPLISLDGSALIYLADVGEDNALVLNYTSKNGPDWQEPVTLPKPLNQHLNFIYGFGLSPDGKAIYLSNPKSTGVGGFDIYVTRLTGKVWSEPENLTLPINTKGNEASPSFSPDGNTIYFMRCDQMSATSCAGCALWRAGKKPNGQWEEPQLLPASINTGNSQTPRMMGDGETLIFSSDRLTPTKGGMDLYMSRFQEGKWSKPVPLDFANTPDNDQYVSGTSVGMYLLCDMKGTRYRELTELLFPPDVKPKSIVRVEGVVASDGGSHAFVALTSLKDQKQVASVVPGQDGRFVMYVKGGDRYEIAIEPEQDRYTWYARTLDYTGERVPQTEKISAQIKPLAAGDVITLENIRFKPYSAELSPDATQEIRRLSRIIHGNAEKNFGVEVVLQGLETDSIASSPDLTEIIRDTIRIPITYRVDSVTEATRDSVVVHTRYHNDRTSRMAEKIVAALVQQGIPATRIKTTYRAIPEPVAENRKVIVRLTAR